MNIIGRMIIAGSFAFAMPTEPRCAGSVDRNEAESVTIYFGPDQYSLPQADVAGGQHAVPFLHVNALSFMFLLPDMRPASLSPEIANAPGWGDKVTVLLQYGRSFKSVKDRLADFSKAANAQLSDMPKPASCTAYTGNFITTSDLRVCNYSGHYFIITCAIPFKYLKYPSCEIFENIQNNTIAIVTFGKNNVSSAPALERFVFDYLPAHRV